MALPSLALKESSSGSPSYCRKQKSLGLLCSNFLSLYNRDGVETVGLDDAAARLGVERRRIYDIVNVLESIGILVKKAKSTYYWKGVGEIPRALQQLKEDGFRENGESFNDEDENFHNPSVEANQDFMHKIPGSSKSENRKEKSLGLLTKNFLKLFLCTNSEMFSLDDAAKKLLGDAHNPSLTRTKVRRLYDIANVLSSMKFIEKIHHPETGKPAFKWLGRRGQPDRVTPIDPVLKDSKKRVFGTDLTNMCFKRSKLVSPVDVDTNQDMKPPLHSQGECESDETGTNEVEKAHDFENLDSGYPPKYHNQALRDLFVHYMEAWKSWYSQVAEMDPIC